MYNLNCDNIIWNMGVINDNTYIYINAHGRESHAMNKFIVHCILIITDINYYIHICVYIGINIGIYTLRDIVKVAYMYLLCRGKRSQ